MNRNTSRMNPAVHRWFAPAVAWRSQKHALILLQIGSIKQGKDYQTMIRGYQMSEETYRLVLNCVMNAETERESSCVGFRHAKCSVQKSRGNILKLNARAGEINATLKY